MKKLGEKAWAALTEEERQHMIMQIKPKEKKLQRQEKYNDLAKLFQNLTITEQGKFLRHNSIFLFVGSCFFHRYFLLTPVPTLSFVLVFESTLIAV